MENHRYQFNDCKKLFLEHLTRHNYSMETLDGYGKDLEYFGQFMMKASSELDFSMDKVNRETLLTFMDDGKSRGNQAGTIARRLSTIKTFYKFLVYELDYPVDVAARIRKPKVYVPLKNILTEHEMERLLVASYDLGYQYHLLFNTLYYTGSRLTPVRTLERQHVDLKGEVIYFPKVKGGKDQYLPLHPALKKLFQEFFSSRTGELERFVFQSPKVPNQPLSPSDIRNKLRTATELAGLKQAITPHTIRHCTATHLTLKDVPQQKIARILGHADLRSTMRYQHLTVEHLRDSLGVL